MKTTFLLFSECSLQQRKTLSAAAEEGCLSKSFLATADHCGRLEVILPPRHRRFPDGGRLTLAISARVGAFSTSRSNLELDESVEDPEAVDACSILLSDSLLSGQFGVSAILHVQGNVSGPDHTSVYYNIIIIIPSNCRIIPQLCSLFFPTYYAPNYARIIAAGLLPPTYYH